MRRNNKSTPFNRVKKFLFQLGSPFLFYIFGFSIVCSAATFNQLVNPDRNQAISAKLNSDNISLSTENLSFTQISDETIELNDVGNGLTEITNSDYQAQSYRVSVLRWTVENGQNVYEQSDNLLVEPASFLLHSKEKKIINIRLKKRNRSHDKQFYQLAVKEVPPLIENRVIDNKYNYYLSVFVPAETRLMNTAMQ